MSHDEQCFKHIFLRAKPYKSNLKIYYIEFKILTVWPIKIKLVLYRLKKVFKSSGNPNDNTK